ncbi:hypothetical protein JW865_09290 [Candidatus Bathyarchaeota archaeon]|nr:hypothetical protein [Candidatus Bathyarchaeota archaeon]
MKVIGFWEYKPDDVNKVIERWMAKLKVNDPDFPKTIYGPYELFSPIFPNENRQGFTILEVEKLEQLAAISSFYVPLLNWRFIPILENSITVEVFNKWQQK